MDAQKVCRGRTTTTIIAQGRDTRGGGRGEAGLGVAALEVLGETNPLFLSPRIVRGCLND